jgi:hypothetical protein
MGKLSAERAGIVLMSCGERPGTTVTVICVHLVECLGLAARPAPAGHKNTRIFSGAYSMHRIQLMAWQASGKWRICGSKGLRI